MALDTRSFVGRYFGLQIDGKDAGLCRAVEGGGIKGELITQQIGGQPYRIKHINTPTIEPITVQVGMSMSKDFYKWIESSWAGECERRNGSITVYDYDFKPKFEYSFTEALILETTFPALDGQSKDPGFMTVKFQPETAQNNFGAGSARIMTRAPAIQTQWLPSNFVLNIDGLEMSRVSKIDSITVKQNVKPMSCGPDWMYQLEPTSLEFPNLTVYCAMSHAEKLYNWHKEFVIDGKNGPDNEKTGSIVFMTPDLNTELLTIDLKAIGILNIVAEKSDTNSEAQIKRCKVELYVEEMSFKYEAVT